MPNATDGGVRAKNELEEPPMTEHEHEMVPILCARIRDETDITAFRELVIELNILLDKVLGQPPSGLD